MKKQKQGLLSSEMRPFTLVWSGQLVSLVGTGFTEFALAVWVYLHTTSVTQYALVTICITLPGVIVAPLAGTLVDRWDRRWTMVFSDVFSVLGTLLIILLAVTGVLNVWFICLATIIKSVSTAFQRPAYFALVARMVPDDLLSRANGMIQFTFAASQLIAPVLSGTLLIIIQLQGILLIDLLSFLFSIMTLLLVRLPQNVSMPTKQAVKKTLLHDSIAVWQYLLERRGLLALIGLFTAVNFLVGIVSVLVAPMILSFASPALLGTVMSIGGSGMLIGAIVMSAWGGLRRRVSTIFLFLTLGGLSLMLAGLRPWLPLITIAAFLFFFGLPMINSAVNALLQSQTGSDWQGRVFSTLDMAAGAMIPLASLIAGPLADRVFVPALTQNGLLASTVGQIIGVGAGRGIGLLFIVTGFLLICLTAWGAFYPHLRHLEDKPTQSASDIPASQVSQEETDSQITSLQT